MFQIRRKLSYTKGSVTLALGACEEMCIKPTFHWCNDTFLLWKIGFDDENCSGQAKPPMHCSSLAIQSYWEELGCFIHFVEVNFYKSKIKGLVTIHKRSRERETVFD